MGKRPSVWVHSQACPEELVSDELWVSRCGGRGKAPFLVLGSDFGVVKAVK